MIYAKRIVPGLKRFYSGHFQNTPNIKTFSAMLPNSKNVENTAISVNRDIFMGQKCSNSEIVNKDVRKKRQNDTYVLHLCNEWNPGLDLLRGRSAY